MCVQHMCVSELEFCNVFVFDISRDDFGVFFLEHPVFGVLTKVDDLFLFVHFHKLGGRLYSILCYLKKIVIIFSYISFIEMIFLMN